jgi:hypothetical protein
MFTVSKARASKIGARMHPASQSSRALLLTYGSRQQVSISPSYQHITFINDPDPGLIVLVLQLASRYPVRGFCHGAPGCVYFMHIFSCYTVHRIVGKERCIPCLAPGTIALGLGYTTK